jgi:hypothetical protein
MKIGIVSVDSKLPNLALMKLSAWHKSNGDEVSIYNPLFDKPDLIYASKVFTTTADYAYFPSDIPVVKGGSGYNYDVKLEDEVESVYPDYELFDCDYALGFTTRGCIRKCPFCIVPKKEGSIRVVADIYQFWRGQDKLMLLDNNLTALPDHFVSVLQSLIKEKIRTDFAQGFDIRLITDERQYLRRLLGMSSG